MSVYNSQNTLSSALDSVLNQTYDNFEFIIINDGSTDNTSSILGEYKKIDSRIIIIDQKNKGLTRSLNIGIKQARGKYIARQDSDDISLVNRLEKQVEFLEARGDVVLLGARAYEISGTDKQVGKYYSEEEINEIVFLYNPIAHTSAFFRKDIFEQIGLYNENFVTSQDFEAWMRLAEVGKIAMLNDTLVEYHINNESVSSKKRLMQCINGYKARKSKINIFKNIYLFSYQYIANHFPKWLIKLKRLG